MKDTITKIQPSDLISDSMVKINRNFEIIAQRLTILRTGAIAAGGFSE